MQWWQTEVCFIYILDRGTFVNDVPRFLTIFDLPTYLVLLYNVPFWGFLGPPLPTLIWDVINERSLSNLFSRINFLPWAVLVVKTLEIKTTMPTFVKSTFKNDIKIIAGLVFWFPTFLLTKLLREGISLWKKNTYLK